MPILPPLLYRGSVKNVRGEVSAESLLFEFSDRYSVFDWGEMPDQLKGKGTTLAIMGKSFFKYLENSKNWIGLLDSEIISKSFDKNYLNQLRNSKLYKEYCQSGLRHHALLENVDSPWNSPFMRVKNISILRAPVLADHTYQYDQYKSKPVNALVPLEIIFRLGLAPGNSYSKRTGVPETQKLMEKPILDFSTKLERGDRYLSFNEAREIAGLSDSEWDDLQTMTHLIALNLFSFHQLLGLELWDGKIEVAFVPGSNGERSFMLVDSIGIDELRLLYKGKSFSKEFLREVYKNTEWFKFLEAAKKESTLTGIDFKEICLDKYHSQPLPLETEIKERAEAVYKSYCNEVSALMGFGLPFEESFNLKNYAARYL